MKKFLSGLIIKPDSAIDAADMVGEAHKLESGNVRLGRTEKLNITSRERKFSHSADL